MMRVDHDAGGFRIGQGQHAVEADLGRNGLLQRLAVDQDFGNQIVARFEDRPALVRAAFPAR